MMALRLCAPKRSNSSSSIPYTEICDDDELLQQQRQQQFRRRWLMFAALLTVATVVLVIPHNKSWSLPFAPKSWSLPFAPFGYRSPSSSSPPHSVHDASPKQHLLPTILYVVDPLTGMYLHAIHNPLYEQLHDAAASTFVTTNNNESDAVMDQQHQLPQLLSVDRLVYHENQSLTLSWRSDLVHDDDWILLHCGSDGDDNNSNNSSNWNDPRRFLEAATIAHARATSRKHSHKSGGGGGGGGDVETEQRDDQWYIPRFPLTQHRVCQFSLYRLQPAPSVPLEESITTTTTTSATSSRALFQLLSKSPMITMQGPETPVAVHLALTSDPSKIVIHFTTFVEGMPTVRYWGADTEGQTEGGWRTTTYTAEDMCQAPANITEAGKFQSPGYLHQVTLQGLTPETLYHYQVGILPYQTTTDGVRKVLNYTGIWAGPFHFTTPPPRGDVKPFVYLVYGDQGVVTDTFGDQGQWTAAMVARESNRSSSTTMQQQQQLQQYPLVAIHHFGDLSYAMGAAHVWEDWFYQISSFSPYVPLMISVGNHEYDHTEGGAKGKDPSNVTDPHGYMPRWGNFGDDSGGECGVPTAARFGMPQSPGSNGVFWYSFDMASVHTIVLSSEHDLFPGSPQHAWLLDDLALVNRSMTPWLVVDLHRPLYEAEPSVPNNLVGVFLRRAIDDVLVHYKVDLVLSGHYHAYHRTCDGLYRGKCHNGGPMHITVGSAGASLDPALPLFPVRWTETFIAQEFGYGRITVLNATVLRFDFVKAGPPTDPTAGDIHDTAWIVRQR